jgi:hypothetical protein
MNFQVFFYRLMNFKSVEEKKISISQIVLNYCPPYFMIVSSMSIIITLRANLKLNL